MDFLERILHLSPDGGTGLTEVALLLSTLLAATLVPAFRQLRQRRKSSNQSSQ